MRLKLLLTLLISVGYALHPLPRPSFDPNGTHVSSRTEGEQRIYNGDDAAVGEFPFMALLFLGRWGSYCGGSIIGPRLILTAGHCTVDFNARQISVRLGEHDFSQPEGDDDRTYSVQRIIVHEDYMVRRDGIPRFDISILQLSEDIEFSDRIAAIGLPEEQGDGELYAQGEAVTVAGWGYSENGATYVLQKLVYGMISDDLCSEGWSTLSMGLFPEMQCTGMVDSQGNPDYGNQHTWSGDSGGPLFVQRDDGSFTQVSLVSWGSVYASDGTPDVNSDLLYFRQWIDEQVACYGDGQTAECGAPPPLNLVFVNDPDSQSEGIVLAQLQEDDPYLFICNDGLGRNEVDVMCQTFGFETGTLLDPYFVDAMEGLVAEGETEFGITDLSCGSRVLEECTWSLYENADVPCVNGQQVAVSCSSRREMFIIELLAFTTRNNYNGEAGTVGGMIKPSIIRYGGTIRRDLDEWLDARVLDRSPEGDYTFVDIQTEYRNRRRGGGRWNWWTSETGSSCLVAVVYLKDNPSASNYTVRISGDCSYGVSQQTVEREIWDVVLQDMVNSTN